MSRWVMAALLAGLLIGWTANGWRLGQQIEAITAAQALERAGHIELVRAEERRRAIELERVQRDAQNEIERIAADAAVAGSAAVGLQRELATVRRRLAACSSTTTGGATTRNTGVLLTDLLSEMERAGRELAAEADRRGVAGRACEAAYSALRSSDD